MRQLYRKVKLDGYTFDSKKEARFYQQFIKPSGLHYRVHPSFELVEKFQLGGYNQAGASYAPDFVVYGRDGKVAHIYDVKTSLSPLGTTTAAKLRFKWFQYRYRKPVEIVVPRQHDFKMTLYGFTVKTMLDQHEKKDRRGQVKRTKTGKPQYSYYNVYQDINYDINEIVGW